MQPIFIMSSERSGSNLLRRMLGAHPAVAAPPPPHLWRIFAPLLVHYGPLDQEQSWRELLSDMLQMTKVPDSHLAWKHVLSAEDVLPRIRCTNLTGLAGALYESYAACEDARFWTCKENNLFEHALRIVDVYPEARFLYLVRDGRDVACSIKKVPTHDQHEYFIAREWRDEQLACITAYQDLLPSGRCRLVRYEELIEDTESQLRDLCGFLELEYDPAMTAFHEDREAQEEAGKTQYWKNLSKPVMSDNKAKFLRELTPSEIAIFESVAADVLEVLGYPLHAEHTPSIGSVRRWLFHVRNRQQKRAKHKKLFDERGRRERADTMRAINRARKQGDRPPLAPSISYGK